MPRKPTRSQLCDAVCSMISCPRRRPGSIHLSRAELEHLRIYLIISNDLAKQTIPKVEELLSKHAKARTQNRTGYGFARG